MSFVYRRVGLKKSHRTHWDEEESFMKHRRQATDIGSVSPPSEGYVIVPDFRSGFGHSFGFTHCRSTPSHL